MPGDPILDFNFSENEAWKEYFSKFEFSSSNLHPSAISKLKRKWYKKNIDPDYEFNGSEIYEESTVKETTSCKHSTKETKKPNFFDNFLWKFKFFKNQVKSSKLKEYLLSNKLIVLWWLLQVFIVVNSIFSFGSLFFSNSELYLKRSFKAAILAYLLSLYATYGLPKINVSFLHRILSDSTTPYILYCVIFLTSALNLVSLLPILLQSIYHSALQTEKMMKIALSNSIVDSKINRILGANFVKISARIAIFEVFQVILILFNIFFTRSMSLLNIFMYYHFLKLRYESNAEMRSIIDRIKFSMRNFLLSSFLVPNFLKNMFVRLCCR